MDRQMNEAPRLKEGAKQGFYVSARAVADKVAYSWIYVALIAAMAAVSGIFAMEMAVYSVYILIAIAVCLLCRDLLPLIPVVICCYIAPSIGNNPGRNPESIFFPEHGGTMLLTMVAIFVMMLIVRLSVDKQIGWRAIFRTKRHLLWGMVALGAAYMVSGVGVQNYAELAGKNIFFGFLQFVCVALLYLILTAAVKWDEAPAWYLPAVGIGMGFVVIAELISVYITQGVLVDGSIDRVRIYTGWGMYNNVGCMIIMALPFPFYFARKAKTGWIGILTGTLFLLSTGLTSSRGSILTGLLVYLLCAAVTLLYAENKKVTFWYLAVIFTALTVSIGLCWEQISKLLQDILERGLETSRNHIFKKGLEQFQEYPIFGGSFYPIDFVPYEFSSVDAFSEFFPPRWHNTVVQLLACCGVVGLAAYLLHCIQVARMLLRKTSLLKAVIGLSVVALMVSSLLDCHFFNLGPVLFYSMALAVAERSEQE